MSVGVWVGRLGKEAAETALELISRDRMPVPDAIKTGSALMGQKLSPSAERLIRQNKRIRERFAAMNDENNMRFPDEVDETMNQFYNPEMFGWLNKRSMKGISRRNDDGDIFPSMTRDARRDFQKDVEFSGDKISAANGYAIKQLLLDAAEGNADIAALLARRLGFEELL